MRNFLMLEWILQYPVLSEVWFAYVTFHDLIQWAIMIVLAHTTWGQRKKKKQLEELIEHIHEELHTHIAEDSSFHEDLGQSGMTKGA